jgi:hypothetical protein
MLRQQLTRRIPQIGQITRTDHPGRRKLPDPVTQFDLLGVHGIEPVKAGPIVVAKMSELPSVAKSIGLPMAEPVMLMTPGAAGCTPTSFGDSVRAFIPIATRLRMPLVLILNTCLICDAGKINAPSSAEVPGLSASPPSIKYRPAAHRLGFQCILVDLTVVALITRNGAPFRP